MAREITVVHALERVRNFRTDTRLIQIGDTLWVPSRERNGEPVPTNSAAKITDVRVLV